MYTKPVVVVVNIYEDIPVFTACNSYENDCRAGYEFGHNNF